MPEHSPQVFDAFGQVWDVEEARRRVAGRQPETLVIDEFLVEWAQFLTRGEPLAGRSLADPIFVIPLPDTVFGPDPGHQVIDGWHRIALAVVEGVSEIPVQFLTPTDERACRAGDDWDSVLVEVFRESHVPWHAKRANS